ncbi:MAG: hypothetical protein J7496_06660 [Novosphingobium sp.]|nr:hypothetical protein [Novosphingobium sp.]MBO9602172.1 hypothetical protein [Novosphingobium sp.]
MCAEEPALHANCTYDRAAMLAMDYAEFDQDPASGWRALPAEGCDLEIADLIGDWRTQHESTDPILYWHEGQVRAVAGQIARAIELFERSHEAIDPFGWNLYVDGSVAFLRRDRAALQAARDELAALPRPEDWPPLGMDGKPADVGWPMNLDFLDGFLRCWDEPYKIAYDCPRPGAD